MSILLYVILGFWDRFYLNKLEGGDKLIK